MDIDDFYLREMTRFAVRVLYEEFKITYKPIVYIAALMAADVELDYYDALEAWSRMAHKVLRQPSLEWMDVVQWNADLGYHILKAGAEPEDGLKKWFEDQAEEVRMLADRIYS